MRVVPGSRAFDGLELLEQARAARRSWWPRATRPTRCTRFAVAQEYAERLPRGELVVEDEGQSPLAWQGARLSRAIGDFLDRVL